MKSYERDILLERIEKEGATVGASIPDRIEVQGEAVDLQEFVFEVKRRDTIPAGERDRVERAKKNLRRERLQRKQRIEDSGEQRSTGRSDGSQPSEDGDLSFEEGEELAASIIGIDRALHALENLDSPADIEAEQERNETMDKKRWLSFLKKVLGHDEKGPQVR